MFFSASRDDCGPRLRLWKVYYKMLLLETLKRILRDILSYFNAEETVYPLLRWIIGETALARLTDALGTSVDPEPLPPSLPSLENGELVAEIRASCTFLTTSRGITRNGENRADATGDALSIAIDCSLKEALRVPKATLCTDTLSENHCCVTFAKDDAFVREIEASLAGESDAEKKGDVIGVQCGESDLGKAIELWKEEKMASEPIDGQVEGQKMASEPSNATSEQVEGENKMASEPEESDTPSEDAEGENMVSETSNTTSEQVEEEKMASEDTDCTSEKENKMASEPEKESDTTSEDAEGEKMMASEPTDTTSEQVEGETMASEPEKESDTTSEDEKMTTSEQVEENMATKPVNDSDTPSEPLEVIKTTSNPEKDNDTTSEMADNENMASEPHNTTSEQVEKEKMASEPSDTTCEEDSIASTSGENITSKTSYTTSEENIGSEPSETTSDETVEAKSSNTNSEEDKEHTTAAKSDTEQDKGAATCPLQKKCPQLAPCAAAASKKSLETTKRDQATATTTSSKKRRKKKKTAKTKARSSSPPPTECPRPNDSNADDETCPLYQLCPQLAPGAKDKMYPSPPRSSLVTGKVTFNAPLFNEKDFDLRVSQETLSLESVQIEESQILGYVRVLNISYEKDITVFYLVEKPNWKIVSTSKGEWVETVCDGTMDRFRFSIPSIDSVGKISFQIRYNGLHVDDNRGEKYTVAYEAK